MFSASVKPIIPNPCDVYITVQNQFQTIRNLNCFNSYTMIPSTDLITIANVTLDCVDKLSEMSTIYIKKINDSSTSVSTNEKIQKMFQEYKDFTINFYLHSILHFLKCLYPLHDVFYIIYGVLR